MGGVTAIIPTRGDVEMGEIVASLPQDWEILIWRNGDRVVKYLPWPRAHSYPAEVPDLGPHARFAAVQYASNDVCYFQDDDVIVSDPLAIVRQWRREANWGSEEARNRHHVVCNLPSEFRVHYPDSSPMGFGSCCDRDAPERAFQRFFAHWPKMERDDPLFLRESCRIFTTLTPRVLVDVKKEDMPYASDPNRLWRDPNHIGYREAALKMARAVRDA